MSHLPVSKDCRRKQICQCWCDEIATLSPKVVRVTYYRCNKKSGSAAISSRKLGKIFPVGFG
jgi:hypothetical protein